MSRQSRDGWGPAVSRDGFSAVLWAQGGIAQVCRAAVPDTAVHTLTSTHSKGTTSVERIPLIFISIIFC